METRVLASNSSTSNPMKEFLMFRVTPEIRSFTLGKWFAWGGYHLEFRRMSRKRVFTEFDTAVANDNVFIKDDNFRNFEGHQDIIDKFDDLMYTEPNWTSSYLTYTFGTRG